MTIGTFFSGLACYRPSFNRKRWGEWTQDVPQYQGTSYCGLCRLHFPAKSSVYGEYCVSDAWQYKYRALACSDPRGEKNIQITDVMTGTPFTDHIGIKRPKGKRKFKKSQPPEAVTYCVHEWCYSAFLWKAKGCPSSVMYRLVRTLSFHFSPWQNDYRDRQSRSLWGLYPGAEESVEIPLSCLSSCSTELQPLSLGGLPAEIRASIWNYAHDSAYAAFLRVTGETAALARKLRKPERTMMCLGEKSIVLGHSIGVFDMSYIHSLNISNPPLTIVRESPLDMGHGPLKRVRGVACIDFVASQGGICALKQFSDGWEGPWIGDVPAAGRSPLWYGTVTNPEKKFIFTYTDLGLMEISNEVEDEPGSVHDSKPKQIVWDRPDYPPPSALPDPASALFDYDPQREFDDSVPERRPFSHVRMLKFLPFTKGSEYMSGLTVYCGTAGGDDGLRMTGIEAHFHETSQISGSREGCAVYFQFAPGEKIAYIWLRSCGDPWHGYLRPSLVIQTTYLRRHHFGPYLSPEWMEEDTLDPYWWIRLESKGYIKGIFYEQPIYNPYFRSVGIVDDSVPLRMPTLMPKYHDWPNSRCPRWIGTPDKDLYISTAFLDPLESITVCRLGERCIGMMIWFSATRVSVLGQWQHQSIAQHVCIFRSREPKLTNLWFQMKRYYPRENSTATTISHIVTDIGVSEDGRVALLSGRDYRAFIPGEEIAWWFTDKYDLIKNSVGEILEVPEARILSQRAFTEEVVS